MEDKGSMTLHTQQNKYLEASIDTRADEPGEWEDLGWIKGKGAIAGLGLGLQAKYPVWR